MDYRKMAALEEKAGAFEYSEYKKTQARGFHSKALNHYRASQQHYRVAKVYRRKAAQPKPTVRIVHSEPVKAEVCSPAPQKSENSSIGSLLGGIAIGICIPIALFLTLLD